MGSKLKRRSSIYDTRIAGLYDLEETIGKGHYAVVKLARHVFTNEKVAVKVIDKTKLDEPSKAHMMEEVRCMKLVQHPNIVRLYEVIDTATKLFLILELADFDMYEYIMRNENGVSECEAQKYFNQIVLAIDYCHTLHVVHRDLKPENVVFMEQLGMVKLTDFGFSNLFTPGEQLETSCGSLAYSAPEILLGDAYDAPAVDVWSLGVILFMMVCGRLPFQEANDSETLTKILDCIYTFPSHVSKDCQEIIRCMLIRDPTKRASLRQIMKFDWVQAGNRGHAEVLPLVSRHTLSEVEHEHIMEQLVIGGIADADTIHRALERNDYSYLTATYYLLAERLLMKERLEKAQQLEQGERENSSQLESLALNSRMQEKIVGDMTIMCTCAEFSNEFCPCVQSKLSQTSEQGKQILQGMVSPVAVKSVAPPAPWQASKDVVTASAPRRMSDCRARMYSIVKEESEEELANYLKSLNNSRSSSRAGSPQQIKRKSPLSSTLYGSSPSNPAHRTLAIQELQELSSRLIATGRTTPDRSSTAGSRSPSPGSGRQSPIVAKYKTLPGPSGLRKLSSSPHLLGICEERELELSPSSSNLESICPTVIPAPTYSSVRSIRLRQAVVSPDVIRRYERAVLGAPPTRTRRSTSCSSSEASDDDSERRYGMIKSGRIRKEDRDNDDNEPPGNGTGTCGQRSTRFSVPFRSASNPETSNAHEQSRKNSGGRSCSTRQLDANKLMYRLQKLVLAPIREVPQALMLLPRLFNSSNALSDTTNKLGGSLERIESEPSNCGLCEDLKDNKIRRIVRPKSCGDIWLAVDNLNEPTNEVMTPDPLSPVLNVSHAPTFNLLSESGTDSQTGDEEEEIDVDKSPRQRMKYRRKRKIRNCRAAQNIAQHLTPVIHCSHG